MPILNPNEPLRTAYVTALRGLNVPVWAKKLPKANTIPPQYIIVSSQTKNVTERSKGCFEWLCTIVIDICYINESGYAKPFTNDDMEALIIDVVEAGLVVNGFDVKSNEFLGSIDLDVETQTQSIERRVITYQHWLCQQ